MAHIRESVARGVIELRETLAEKAIEAIGQINHPEDESGIRRARHYSRMLDEAEKLVRRIVGGNA